MGKANILIVEDDPLIAADIQGILEDHGLNICGNLQTGEAALNYARQTRPDLVLMDIRLEGEMDGIQTAKILWQELQIPCVYLTAHSDHDTVQRAKQSYPSAFLIKPFTARELCIGVEIALNQRAFPPLLEVLGTPDYALLRHGLATAKSHLHTVVTLGDPETVYEMPNPEGIRGDLSADVLDILCGIWLQSAESKSWIEVSADDILRFRGVRAQKSGSGRRGGYDKQWREQIAQHLEQLAQIRSLTAGQASPLLELKRQTAKGPFHWQIQPGPALSQALFAPSPETALLSQKVLQYNPYRQNWEKRLARFFSQHWRENKSSSSSELSIQTLLEALATDIDAKHPLRTKTHLERSLDTLAQDRVIEGWAYSVPATKALTKLTRPQLDFWLTQTLEIEAPANLVEAYAGLVKHSPSTPHAGALSLAFIRTLRQQKKLSLMDAASEIGITHARLSQIERGDVPGPKTYQKIKAWLFQQF